MEAIVAGVVFSLGAMFVFDAITRPKEQFHLGSVAGKLGPRAAAVMGGALAAFVLTGWPVAAVAGGALGWAVPALVARSRSERDQIKRMESVAELAARLRDAMRSGIGLKDALAQAAANPPAPIASEVRKLNADAGIWGTADAVAAFAESVGGPAELLASALPLAERLGSSNTSEMLDALAEATAARTAVLREARARQTRARASARVVAAVPVLLLLAIRHSNPQYLVPFSSAPGQFVLAAGLGLIALGYAVMLRIARLEGIN